MHPQTQTAPYHTPSALPHARDVLRTLSSFAWPLTRGVVGLFLIPHGAQKLFGWFGGYGLTATGQYFETTLGLAPGLLLAGAAGAVEFFGGIALVLGLFTRPAALAVAVLMGIALTVHIPSGYFWTAGGVEFPLMWGLLAVAVLLGGGGPWSLDRRLRMPI